MSNGNLATIDAAGRLVIPKAIREQASLKNGDRLEIVIRRGCIEIIPFPRTVRVTRHGKVATATPEKAGPALTDSVVSQTLDRVRAGTG